MPTWVDNEYHFPELKSFALLGTFLRAKKYLIRLGSNPGSRFRQ